MLDGHKEGIDFYIIPKTERLSDSVVRIIVNSILVHLHMRKQTVTGFGLKSTAFNSDTDRVAGSFTKLSNRKRLVPGGVTA